MSRERQRCLKEGRGRRNVTEEWLSKLDGNTRFMGELDFGKVRKGENL